MFYYIFISLKILAVVVETRGADEQIKLEDQYIVFLFSSK